MAFVMELCSLCGSPMGLLPAWKSGNNILGFFLKNLQKKEGNANQNKNVNSRDMIILRLTRKKSELFIIKPMYPPPLK